MAPIAVSALLGIGSQLIERLWPEPAEAEKPKMELLKMQANGELQQMIAQLQVNAAEAANPSLFVAGWCSAVGSGCAAALVAYQYSGCPLVAWGFAIAGHPMPPMPEHDHLTLRHCLVVAIPLRWPAD